MFIGFFNIISCIHVITQVVNFLYKAIISMLFFFSLFCPSIVMLLKVYKRCLQENIPLDFSTVKDPNQPAQLDPPSRLEILDIKTFDFTI